MWSGEGKGALPPPPGPQACPAPSGPGTAPPPAPITFPALAAPAEGHFPLEPAASAGPAVGEGYLPVARRPGPRFRVLLAQVPLALTVAMQCAPSFLLLLLLLAMSAPSQAWSRPLWYQVGLDLQPWGCQPSSLDGCGVSLGCPGHWMGLGMNPIYSVTGVMLTSAMVLMVGRKVLQRWGPQDARSKVSAPWSPGLRSGPTPGEPIPARPAPPRTSLLPTSASPSPIDP